MTPAELAAIEALWAAPRDPDPAKNAELVIRQANCVPVLLEEIAKQAREMEAVTSARESIASYFEHLSRVQIGIIDLTGTPAHEFYATIAAWVRNRLDVTWAEEARAALAGGEEG